MNEERFEEMEAAKVVRIVGNGTGMLRSAIESGIVNAEIKRAIEDVLIENENLRRVNREIKKRLMESERQLAIAAAKNRENMKTKIGAYEKVIARESEFEADKFTRRLKYMIMFGCGMLVVMGVTTVLVMGMMR